MSVPDVIPYVNVWDESTSEPPRPRVTELKVSAADVSVKETDVGVGRTGRLLKFTVVPEEVAEAGPVFDAASNAPATRNTGTIVPAEQPVMVTVRVVPESVPGSNEQDVAVPLLLKSADVIPVTDSENVNVYVIDVRLLGLEIAEVNEEMVGAVPSTMCDVLAETAEWVIVAVAPTESVIVPPFSAKALAAIDRPEAALSPATIV